MLYLPWNKAADKIKLWSETNIQDQRQSEITVCEFHEAGHP
jgi:Zn ribbon nucleic-acid-binding protein